MCIYCLAVLKTNLFSHNLSKCNFILNFDFNAFLYISDLQQLDKILSNLIRAEYHFQQGTVVDEVATGKSVVMSSSPLSVGLGADMIFNFSFK